MGVLPDLGRDREYDVTSCRTLRAARLGREPASLGNINTETNTDGRLQCQGIIVSLMKSKFQTSSVSTPGSGANAQTADENRER